MQLYVYTMFAGNWSPDGTLMDPPTCEVRRTVCVSAHCVCVFRLTHSRFVSIHCAHICTCVCTHTRTLSLSLSLSHTHTHTHTTHEHTGLEICICCVCVEICMCCVCV